MRKIIGLAALILSAVVEMSAQQAIWGVPDIVSPEVNADRSVTFRLKAPEARSVKVTGDFLSGPAVEMTRDSVGVWSFTSPAVKPEMYRYNYIVDGLIITDPGNVYELRDACTVFNFFIVPDADGGTASLYEIKDVAHGTVVKTWYDSPVLGMKRRLSVYTPPGYEQSDGLYPVFYLLHGMGGDEETWLTQGRAAQIFDNLIARGMMEPMIVVMPNGNASQEAAPGETHFGLVAPTVALPHTMDGAFEEAFPDIVAFVDKTYRTKADKEHRAIAGLSMGGFHSLHISKQYPDLFGYVGLFSAAINPRVEGSEIYKDRESKLKRQFADAPKLYWIGIGSDDFLYKDNEAYRRQLDKLGIEYEYNESPGGHIWKNWRNYLVTFAQRLFR